MESLDLAAARIVVESRPSYLLVTERGRLISARDVQRYSVFVEAIAIGRGRSALLVDARLGEPALRDPAVSDAFWRWVTSGRVLDRVAWVLPPTLAVVPVEGAPADVRTFSTTQDAHRWLAADPLSTAPTIPAPRPATPPGLPRSLAGARRPTGGSEERVALEPRSVSSRPPEAPRSERAPISTPIAAIRPSQVAISRAELERARASEPPREGEERTPIVYRSDVVPRPRAAETTTLDETGSDDDT